MAEQENDVPDRLDTAKGIIAVVLDEPNLERDDIEHQLRVASAAALVDIAISLRSMRMSAFATSTQRRTPARH